MALSMDEQRILDGMERKLADDDPRLATRLAAFGQPRLPVLLGSGRARAVFVLISLALAAIVALMVYSMRPLPGDQGQLPARAHSSSSTAAPASGTPASKAARPAG